MQLTTEQTSGGAVVTAAGRLTTSQAGRLHGLLREAFERSRRVELVLLEVQEADLSFLQLLCAAHRTAAERGSEFLVSGLEAADPVLRLIREAGAERDAGCPGSCMWSGVPAARGDELPQP